METIEYFKENQVKTISVLNRLISYIEEGEQFIGPADQSILDKLYQNIHEEEDRKLQIALIGGFSEGKTSIAAAWSEKYDQSSMKINQEESTDNISIYTFEDFNLVDTPGLFGYKENIDDVEYKQITKKYVSEADLILYVVNPNNPIKESHQEELVWLFKDLNLLARTIVVISRFDEEVDIEDEEEYQEGFLIKKENILTRLRDFTLLEKDQEVPIVAVSANPFNEGLSYWLNNMNEFKELSRIGKLQAATTYLIKESGGNRTLIRDTQQSVVRDILLQKIPEAEEFLTEVSLEIEKIERVHEDFTTSLNEIQNRVNITRIELRDFVRDYFTDLILQVKGTSIDTIDDFSERNIGSEGIVLENTIQSEFERHVGTLNNEIHKNQIDYNNNINYYNDFVENKAKKGLKFGSEFLKNSKFTIDNTTILGIRDLVLPNFKFKPWGAIKLADGLNRGIPYIGDTLGIGIELWDSYSTYKKQEEFEKVIKSTVSNFEEQRKQYIELINNNSSFVKTFFPTFTESKKQAKVLEVKIREKKLFKKDFEEWKQKGLNLEIEFEELLQENDNI